MTACFVVIAQEGSSMIIASSFLISRRQILLTGVGSAAAILPIRSISAETPRSFMMNEAPKPVPVIQFIDSEGRGRTLADFSGKIVLLNIWATWCSSCRKEMPALDRIQAKLGGADFQVVALSIDRKGPAVVRQFYAEIGIQHLSLFVDASGTALQKFGGFGLPATLLIDRQGQELGRLIGPAEWDEPEMLAFLKNVIAGQASTSSSSQQKEDSP